MTVCYRNSATVWRGTINGMVAAVWGLAPTSLLSGSAYLWLYTTPVVDDHKFIFARYSQLFMEQMLDVYPEIRGHVVAGEDRSVRWLKWLGATFGEPEGKMIPFKIRKRANGS